MQSSLTDRLRALPAHAQLDAVRAIKRKLYCDSLYSFARHALGYDALNMRTHATMIRALESPRPRKLIVMPRGTFKSSVCSVAFPIWGLCRNPNLRILLDSELYSNSKNFLREIKAHLTGSHLTELFGTFRTDACWNEGEIIIAQRTKVLKEASITASGIGAEKTGQHYDLIICDDLNSPSNSGTPEGRDKVLQHYRYNTSILEPTGTLVIVATRYAELDVPGYVLRTEVIPASKSQDAEL